MIPAPVILFNQSTPYTIRSFNCAREYIETTLIEMHSLVSKSGDSKGYAEKSFEIAVKLGKKIIKKNSCMGKDLQTIERAYNHVFKLCRGDK